METISLNWGVVVMQVLGLPGLIFIIWHFDNKRYQRQEALHREMLSTVLEQYRKDVSEIKRLYESNSRLLSRSMEAFERLEKLYGEAMSIISLNTQTQTNLTNAIKNNQFCPVARKAVNE